MNVSFGRIAPLQTPISDETAIELLTCWILEARMSRRPNADIVRLNRLRWRLTHPTGRNPRNPNWRKHHNV